MTLTVAIADEGSRVVGYDPTAEGQSAGGGVRLRDVG